MYARFLILEYSKVIKKPQTLAGQTYFVQMDILSWEDIPMVFYSVEELEQLQNKDSKKVIFNPSTAKSAKRPSLMESRNALWYSALLHDTVATAF